MDSTFSLRNSDEYIALKNATLNIVDEVTYNSSWGADGNGKTLERTATGGWAESTVDGGTPCTENGMTIVRRGTPIIVEEKRIGTVVITRLTTGDIKINEIMYNLPGADADLEWIELYNDVTKAINITAWKFYEADTNHRLVLVQGSMVIPVGGYAIIANNATAFLKEHPLCNCTVIDSTFSLRNTGEYIALKNATLVLVDNVAYNSSWGADGNGKTLERTATGAWAESTVDGGTPCAENGEAIVIPYSSWIPPVIYTSNITVDTMNPENVGKNATTGLFTATEVIDNETYYVVNISTPSGYTKMYVGMDVDNKDSLMKRTVIPPEPELGIISYTFDPAIVMWDFPLMTGKTWSSTSNVTVTLYVNQTPDEPIVFNYTTVVSGEVTAEVVTVPLGTFPCLVIENNMSSEIEGMQGWNSRKYWISPTDTGFLCPKYQSYLQGNLVEELELMEVIPPTFLNATDNNTAINAITGRFLVIILEGNPTTGYTWEVTEPLDELVLQQVGDIAFVQDYAEPGLVGVPGVQIATFEVVGAGNATIKMVYHQPWETDVEPLDTFTLNVTAS